MKNIISIGALFGAFGVILGAFGTHALQGKIEPDLFEIYKTGCQYMMMHAFALILYGLSGIETKWPAWCFGLGIVVFSGSLYCITFTGIRMFGAITPIGGLLFIAGWIGFAIQARTSSSAMKHIQPISNQKAD
jgi:uncharacterized membrane protein YgdD (TMEM256/DUF423 family)